MEQLKNLHVTTQLALFIQLTYWINLIILTICCLFFSNKLCIEIVLQLFFCCLNPLIGFFISILSVVIEKNKKVAIVCLTLNIIVIVLNIISYIFLLSITPKDYTND